MKEEDLRLKPYRDTVGKLTIGYGRNLDDKGISVDEAAYFLDDDIPYHTKELENFPFFNGLDDARKIVLADMSFNLGFKRLSGFRKMLAAVANKDYETAANEMLDSTWATQVGERAERLAEMMRTGENDGYGLD